MGLPVVVLSGFALALAAPWLFRISGRWAPWLLALSALALTGGLLAGIPEIAAGRAVAVSYPWAPALGLHFSLRLDGLSLLFGVLITGVGALILVYSGGYMAHHPYRGRFFGLILMFMAAMLGVVLADNLLLLYVFWELTSVASWLLIGFESQRPEARQAAWQALLVTSAGGLALLAGVVLLGQTAGTFELSALLLRREDAVRSHGLYVPILLLILAGAFTKSAQSPFHFWLPNAMAAPTPVSAYLHSATMVKAGIYLLARLSPALAGTDLWRGLVAGFGTATMLTGAGLTVVHTDMKRVLAYTTISALGMIVLMLGVGSEAAVTAALLFIVAHALYKGAMFLVAGIVDHETGTRDVSRLRGLWRVMPDTAGTALAAFLSMVGAPPTLGFISHEGFLQAMLEPATILAWGVTAAVVLASLLYTAAACILTFRPFLGTHTEPPQVLAPPRNAPPSMWIAAGIPAILGVAGAFFARRIGDLLISPAASAVLGRPVPAKIRPWHGFTPEFALGIGAILAGLLLYASHPLPRRLLARLRAVGRAGPDRIYESLIDGMNALARAQTRLLQNGSLPTYVLVVFVAMAGMMGWALRATGGAVRLGGPPPRAPELLVAIVTLIAAIGIVLFTSRTAVIVTMGVIGYAVALFFAFFSAPDLAIAQFLVETLFVVLVILTLRRLPDFRHLDSRAGAARDAVVALAVGALMSLLLILVSARPPDATLPRYFAEHSQPRAYGRNIVNVILVDFRALDTLVEITVLSAAAVGIHVLLKPGAAPRRPIPSLLLNIAARFLLPIVLLFSIFLLLRGHNEPGGGFAAGLVTAIAIALYLIGAGRRAVRRLLPVQPLALITAGLLLAGASGLWAVAGGGPYLESRWYPGELPLLGGFHPGTPFLFDVGVCLVAAGSILLGMLSLEEQQ